MASHPIESTAGALQRLIADSFATRLWKRDSSLWPDPSPGGDPADQTLGWLDLPLRVAGLAEKFASLSSQLATDGFTDVVVLGMGGSSMTPLTLSSLYTEQSKRTIRLHVLDTVNPTSISHITTKLNLNKTLFFVSSKSGTTVEPLNLEAHFRSELADGEAGSANRRNFIALTDPGTPLSERARAGEFGTWVSTPKDVGGRFSALSAFGMMPAAATGIDIRNFSDSAARVAQSCQTDSIKNPGLELGAFLGANALTGRDKVTMLTTPEYSTFGMWVDQLLAESTGKNGNGLVPVTGEPALETAMYGSDRQFVVFDTDVGQGGLKHRAAELEAAGHSVLTLTPLNSEKHEIAGEFFRWQFAIAAACSLMDIYPFDQPDVEMAKVKSRELLSNPTSDIDATSFAKAFDALSSAKPPSYVALIAFLPESPELTASFSALRKAISSKTGMATTFGYGPRYLHATGQLYKGGPQNAMVLGFVSGKYDDLAVPGEEYSFGELTAAQAGGDFLVMKDRGQSVLPLEIGNDPVAEIEAATQELIG